MSVHDAIILRPRLCKEIENLTEKLLRELGAPEPPVNLDDIRELLQLDRSYFSNERDDLLASVASKLKRGGKQLLRRPTLLFDAIRKIELRALYLPDHKRILIDESIPKPKHRWLEAHEIGHDLLPWHREMMLGDDDVTPTVSTHSKMEAEANYAAGALLFMGNRFRQECLQVDPTIANVQKLRVRYGNTITTTLWRLIEYAGDERPLFGIIGAHPQDMTGKSLFRHFIPSRAYNERFRWPEKDKLVDTIRSYCVGRYHGPLGSGEMEIGDILGRRHVFQIETFFNGHDALTMGCYLREVNCIVSL